MVANAEFTVPNHRNLSYKEEQALAHRYHAGDKQAGDELLMHYQKFVAKVAWDYNGYGFPMEDLFQEGFIGLCRALARFDAKRGFKFGTYARHWVSAFIRMYVMDNWSLVKFTTGNQRMLFFSVRRLRTELEAAGLEPYEVIEEIARRTKMKAQAVEEIEQRIIHPGPSIDSLIPGHEATYAAFIRDPRPLPEEQVADMDEAVYRRVEVRKAMERLSPRERSIVEERVFAEPPTTLRKVGDRLGISCERVRQIEASALDKLRRHLSTVPELVDEHITSNSNKPLRARPSVSPSKY